MGRWVPAPRETSQLSRAAAAGAATVTHVVFLN